MLVFTFLYRIGVLVLIARECACDWQEENVGKHFLQSLSLSVCCWSREKCYAIWRKQNFAIKLPPLLSSIAYSPAAERIFVYIEQQITHCAE